MTTGTRSPPTKSLDFRGFDSSRLLILRDGNSLMSIEFYRGSPGKFDSRTLNRKTLSRWTGRTTGPADLTNGNGSNCNFNHCNCMIHIMYIYIYIYICINTATVTTNCPVDLAYVTSSVSFRNLIVFLGRDTGTLKSDIVSKKHPQSICSDLRLSN